jgi:hypothetical protein
MFWPRWTMPVLAEKFRISKQTVYKILHEDD